MQKAVCCFLLEEGYVWLAQRKDGNSIGLWDGLGGGVESTETLTQALVREIEEESGLTVEPHHLEQRAIIHKYRPGRPLLNLHVFLARQWRGKAKATKEMGEVRRFSIHSLPTAQMREGDVRWLPRILAGEIFSAEIRVGENDSLVQKVRYLPIEFENGEFA